ncbi:MAG: VOC family protein [Candidatus Pacebacteria bacterium]|nr:VOC family protein [Candidatus Paceibacterota bacterium]
MNKLLKIDNIMYRVSDLKKAERFYINILGLKKAWEDENAGMIGFIFEQSDSEIVIHTDPNIPKGEYSYLVEDVVEFCEEVKKQGYKVLSEPFEVRPGKYALLSDPDGNEIPIIDLSKFGGKPRYD